MLASSASRVLPQTQTQTQLARRYLSDKKEEPAAAAAAAPKEEQAEEQAEAAAAPEAEPAAQEELTKEQQLEAQTKALEEQVKELKDQLLRSLAEQENTRHIAKRDVQASRDFAIKSFAKSVLDVSDNLARALATVPKEALEGDDKAVLKTLYEGIDMTDKGLTKAFLMNGLTKFAEQPGDVFNPEMHEALFEYPDPDKVPGTIGQVTKVGFMLNKRVLRPAEVGIIKKP